jgi:hypothetical protein
MASGISVKPVTGGLQVSVERANAVPVPGAVTTELTEAVSAATASDLVRRDPLRPATQAETHIVLDAQSREVICQAIDWSRRVTRQVPAVAARRLKAYSEAEDRSRPNGTQTDTEL